MSKANRVVRDSNPTRVGEHDVASMTFRVFGCHVLRVEDWKLRRPERSYWRLYWNPRGAASVTADGREHELSADRVVLIAPHTFYEGTLHQTRVEHFFVHFQLGEPYDSAGPRVTSVGVDEQIRTRLRAAWRLANRIPDCHDLLILGDLVMTVMARLGGDIWPRRRADARIEAALAAALEDLSAPMSNDRLARIAHMSTNAFIRRFREVMGLAPQAYLTARRMDHARHLLAQTDATIESIAQACGFSGRSHLSTTFSKRMGMGPAAYRRSVS
jgi:AraC-like DNA-binding protein